MTPEELEDLQHQVTARQQVNDTALQNLGKQGVRIDGGSLIGIRLVMLLDTVLGPADGDEVTEERLRYELACQDKFTDMIADIHKQVRTAQLLQGVRGVPQVR